MYYGSSVADRTGEDGTVSKLRKYSFDRSMLPTYEGQEVPETYQGPVDPTTKIPISTEDYMDWAEKRYAKDKPKSEGLNLKERTGITLPDYEEYFKEARSVAELEDQRQSIAQTREFLYSAGLKNLQGNIDKETTKIRIEGQKDLAKIDQATSLYNLINFQMQILTAYNKSIEYFFTMAVNSGAEANMAANINPEDQATDFDIDRFEALLNRLEASKKRQQRQRSVEGRRDIFSQGLAGMMSNF